MSNKIYGYCRISRPTQEIERQVKNISTEYPSAIIVKETFTGTKVYGRKEFLSLLKRVKKGDTIVFDSVSRMSRNADEGVQRYFELNNKGINLIFIKEPHINTDTYKKSLNNCIKVAVDSGNEPTNRFIKNMIDNINEFTADLAKEQIKLAFDQAEKEVTDLRQRTKEGMAQAKLKGNTAGRRAESKVIMRKAAPIKELIKNKCKDFNGTKTDKEVMAILDGEKIRIKNPNGTYKSVSAHVSRNTYYKYKQELIDEINAEQAAES